MDLHLALLVLGVVLIAVIFGLSRYSNVIEDLRRKFNEYRSRKQRESAVRKRAVENAPKFDGLKYNDDEHDSPLFDFSSDSVKSDLEEESNMLFADEPDEVVQTPNTQISQTEQVDAATTTSLREVDEEEHTGPFTSLRQIDYWIKLSPDEQHTQAQILAKLGDWSQITFPVQIHALTLENPQWVSLLDADSGTEIMDVVASYQLLDSGNATTLEDLNNFDELVTQLGEAIGAEKLMMATPEQAFEQSERLAKFHVDNCAPLEVTISAPKSESFMGKLVETSAKQQGLEFRDGEYVRMKKMGTQDIILYRMLSADANKFAEDMPADGMVKRVKFTMIPALSPTPGRDAKEMLDAVKAFASRVKGEIRVPGKPEFHLDQLLNLRNRVSQLEQEMTNVGLEPGGPELHRIFSH